MQSLLRIAALAAIPALFTAQVPAQNCPLGDDGLAAVPCCTTTSPNLPAFPGFQVSGVYCCFKDCAVENSFPIRVTTSHIRVLCDYAVIPLTVLPGTATSPGYSGVLLAKYARTWTEPVGPVPRQVWRFLINGDLDVTSGAQPCPIPPHPAGMKTHFHGHLDYACETDAAGRVVFRMAMSLHHLQGCIEHNFFSCAPLGGGADHADRSYHIIAPGTFTCTTVPVPTGTLVAESVRSTNFFPYRCVGEGQVRQGGLTVSARDWLCLPGTGGPQPWHHYVLSASYFCGTANLPFRCVPLGAPLPPLTTGCAALPIGRWTAPTGTFPDSRELVVHWGVQSMIDACHTPDPPFHVVHGVSTSGVPGMLFSNPTLLVRTFIDLQDMIDPNSLSTGVVRPGWGCLFISKLIWSLNLP